MKKYFIFFTALILIILTLTGCEAIGTIFKAGMWSGIIVVLLVIFLVILLITRINKKN